MSSGRLRGVIAEDEPGLAEELRAQLSAMWPELEVCASAGDGIAAMRDIEEHRPHVVFLDIQMPGLDGMEVARLLRGRCELVFVTAFDHHALEAFDNGAIDYVVKPIQPTRLMVTVQRLRERLRNAPVDAGQVRPTLPPDDGRKEYLRWINASRGNEISIVTTDEVCYFKAEDKYTVVVTETQEALIRKALKELVGLLDPAVFWQIHRATVVNANAIAGVARDFRGHLSVKLKRRPETLPVSESYTHLFRSM